MIMCAKVDVNNRSAQIRRNISPPRSFTELVGSAFLYSPIGKYQQTKIKTAMSVFQGSSTIRLAIIKACHEYVFEGRSRAS